MGVKKPKEAQKAKALWAMNAAKYRKGEFMIRLAKRTFRETLLELWEEHLKDPITALDKALKCVESQY